jgi:hypothetical protein
MEPKMKHKPKIGLAAMFACVSLLVGTAGAQTTPAKPAAPRIKSGAADDAHRKDDIAKHRQMARAHEEAAKCLESGEKESVCQERLREACKGIAVGRYCGMRHAH